MHTRGLSRRHCSVPPDPWPSLTHATRPILALSLHTRHHVQTSFDRIGANTTASPRRSHATHTMHSRAHHLAVACVLEP
eukprot:5008674-Prymnesium_polylepis.1